MSFDGKTPFANEIRVEEDKLLPTQNTKLRIVVETRVNYKRDAKKIMNTKVFQNPNEHYEAEKGSW